jgi:hypothetical protein
MIQPVRRSGRRWEHAPFNRRVELRKPSGRRRSARLRRGGRRFAWRPKLFNDPDGCVQIPCVAHALCKCCDQSDENKRRLGFRPHLERMLGRWMRRMMVFMAVVAGIVMLPVIRSHGVRRSNGVVLMRCAEQMQRQIIEIDSEENGGQQPAPPAGRCRLCGPGLMETRVHDHLLPFGQENLVFN